MKNVSILGNHFSQIDKVNQNYYEKVGKNINNDNENN